MRNLMPIRLLTRYAKFSTHESAITLTFKQTKGQLMVKPITSLKTNIVFGRPPAQLHKKQKTAFKTDFEAKTGADTPTARNLNMFIHNPAIINHFCEKTAHPHDNAGQLARVLTPSAVDRLDDILADPRRWECFVQGVYGNASGITAMQSLKSDIERLLS